MTVPPYPTYPQPHSHDKYIGAIIGVGVVALLIGATLGYGLGSITRPLGTSPQPQPTFTFAHGTADVGSRGTPLAIYFDSQDTGTLSSVVFPSITRNGVTAYGHFYQLYLISGKTYTITIYYDTTFSGIQSCTGRPGVFAASGLESTQDFLC